MRKLAALSVAATLATGCFTTIGGVIGSGQHKQYSSSPDTATVDTYAGEGAFVGLLLDIAVGALLVYKAEHAFDGLQIGDSK